MLSNFRLVMRTGPTVGKIIALDKGELFLGRDLGNDIVINDPEISRRHSRFAMQGNSFSVEDLGSTNGTFVNGQRLSGAYLLRSGDTITFGERLSMVFESADFDPDATVVSSTVQPAYESTPESLYNSVPTPPAAYAEPQPAAYPPPGQAQPVQQPPQAQSYVGQVPEAYAPEQPAKRRSPVLWIVLGAILLLSCICVTVLLWNAPTDFWCIFPIWPSGACP